MKQPEKTMQDYESLMKERRVGSITAEGMAFLRLAESIKPEGERICYDPYAARFIRPELIARYRNQSPARTATGLLRFCHAET
jgi:O-methyltransferase involved in polyketide biosynthesis